MTTTIYEDLVDLLTRAEQRGEWIFCHYQQLWWSPKQFREAIDNGKFIWGVENFHLRSPNELLYQLQKKRDDISFEIERHKELRGLE